MFINAPRGVVPRSQGCNLGPSYASIAENIRLRHGRWEPWKVPKKILDVPGTSRVAHVRDCCWAADDDCLTHYLDAGACEQTYLSGPDRRPEVSPSLCEHDWRFLGLPVPDDISLVSNSLSPDDDGATSTLRSYVITYCTECDEGPPSCPTEPIKVDKQSSVVLSLPVPPDDKWGVTHVNVYRTASTWDSQEGLIDFNPDALTSGWTPTTVNQNFFLVGRIEITEMSFTDNGEKLGKLLTTEDFYPPAEGLRIGGETASGSLVGWIDTEVWFSERNAYHAWPIKARMSFPYKVKAVCVCNDTVYVLTEANAYVLQDSIDCQDSTCRPVAMSKDAYPICSERSCVVTPSGVLYSSLEGLVWLGPDTESRIVSSRAFAKDDWIALDPSRIQLETSQSYLFLLTDQVFFVWDFSIDDSGQLPEDLTTLDFLPDSLIIDDQEQLFFLLGGSVYQFDAGDQYMTMKWRQANQDYGTEGIITSMRGKYLNQKATDLNSISIYQNCELKLCRPLNKNPMRTRTRFGSDYQVEVTGKEPLCVLYYGIGINDLTETSNG